MPRMPILLVTEAEAVHVKKAGWNLTEGLHLALAVIDRGVADAFAKQRAERAWTLKSNFKADVRHAQSARPEQLLRFFNSPAHQILVWRGGKRFAKHAEKMIAGQTSLL